MADPIEIAYIGGSPRSGSTVLAHLIARAFDGVVVGELKDIWYRGPLENQRCSCGQLFRACDFWVDVGSQAFGGWDNLPLEQLVALQRRIDRFRTLPQLLAPELTRRRDPSFHAELAAYRETLGALYRAVLERSGCSFVVESSKHPAQAFVLSASQKLEPKVIHLVRDSRGVAWSFQKQVARPEVADGRLMPQAVPAKAAWQWMLNNLPFHLLWTRGVPQITVRYESYTREPLRALEEIGRLLGRTSTLRSTAELKLDFAEEHSLGGNPVRFKRGALDLQIDDEWRSAMRRPDRLRTGAITFPLLAAYGYVGRGRS
ncbi:MAG TPA: hypothetical protein VGI76_03830 [Solirubrobacteraceae bacterium]|jgi:hypothetical protein